MTDLCWRCQKNNTRIFRSANLSEEEKTELLMEQHRHLSNVDAERKHYNDLVAQSKQTVGQLGLNDLQRTAPNSRDIQLHYSFDFAQQVHLPSNAAQPGPMYFLTPRKCAIFGVCCEGIPKQVNFLVDEAVNVSKGSIGVISYLHFFFWKLWTGGEACPAALRQLFRAEQEQLCSLVFCLAGHEGAPLRGQHQLHARWAY